MKRTRVAIVASWYPTREDPIAGIFVRDQAAALAQVADVAVVAPRIVSLRSMMRRPTRITAESDGDDAFPVLRPSIVFMPRADGINERTYEHTLQGSLGEVRRLLGGLDVINPHVVLPAGLASARIGQRLGIPVVLTEHSSPFSLNVSSGSSRRHVEEALDRAWRVLAVGPCLRDEIQAIKAVRVDVVGNVVADSFFDGDIEVQPPHESLRLLAVGYYVRQKRFDLLLRAVSLAAESVARIELTLVGEGPEGPSLRALADNLGLQDRVRFAGLTSREALRGWLNRTDAVVSSSDHESFALVVAEAIASGRPVVATASGGPDWYVDTDSGMIVPPGDAEALASAIARLPAFVRTYQPAIARSRIQSRFGSNAFAVRMATVFSEATIRRATPEIGG